MSTVLRATSKTIANQLQSRFQADPNLGSLFGPPGTMQVSLNSPQQMAVANTQGLSVWMYRIVRDEERLNDPDLRPGPGFLQSPPLPLRLHYLMTPITSTAANAATAQLIMGKVLQVLNDQTSLRGTDLQDELSGTDTVLNLRLEPLSLQEIYQIWDALEGSYRLSVSYEVSAVDIPAGSAPQPFSPVLVASPEYSQIVERR